MQENYIFFGYKNNKPARDTNSYIRELNKELTD